MSGRWVRGIVAGGAGSLLVAGAMVVATPVAGASPTNLYVVAGGSGDCASPTTPCGSVQTAITDAAGIAGAVTIDVGAGTYTGTLKITPGNEASLTLQPSTPGAAVTITTETYPLTVTAGSPPVAFDGFTFAGGLVGILNYSTLALTGSTVTGSVSGAIDNENGTLTVADSTISGTGQGLDTVDGSADSTVTVTGSTFSGNGTGIGIVGFATGDTDTVTVTGSTITGNGAGVATQVYGAGVNDVTVTGSTISGNTDYNVVATPNHPGGTVALGADLLVNSTGHPDCTATITDLGDNVATDGTCDLGPGSDQTVPASSIGLAALANSGGTTQTEAIPTSSAANEVVPSTLILTGQSSTFCSSDDQRGAGYPRLVTGATSCAAGAFQPDAPLVITTTTLPGGTVGTTYSATLAASGGTGTNSWSWSAATGSSLPPGLNLASGGTLSGTPSAAGTYDVALAVTDAEPIPQTVTEDLSITVQPPATVGGYWEVGSDGGVFAFGDAPFYGSMGGKSLNKPIVGIAATPTGQGYWEVASDGGVFAFGDATFYGSMGGKSLNKPIVGIAATPTGQGYWEVASDGGVFAFGDATFYGSMGGKPLNKPIVGIAATPTGQGYWEVGSDGGIFNFGDATFYGSMGGKPLNKPIVGIAATPTGQGYWEVGSDGGIFNFGDAPFSGSMGGKALSAPIVAIEGTPDGGGYWEVGSDGGIFNFGDAPFSGSMGGRTLAAPVVDIAGT